MLDLPRPQSSHAEWQNTSQETNNSGIHHKMSEAPFWSAPLCSRTDDKATRHEPDVFGR